jgi:NitT/TauT family transport system substrate-binding protein
VPAEPEGLAGRRIGTPGRFGSSWHALLALLDAAGLTENDVSIREYPQFNQAEGLLNGDVELITGFRNNEPLRLSAAGMESDLLTLDEAAPLPGPGIVVGDQLLREQPELVRAFVEATMRGMRVVIEDVELGLAAAQAAVPAIAEDPVTARRVLQATVELWAGPQGFAEGRIDLARWEEALIIMSRLGFVGDDITVQEMTEPISAPAAAGAGGGG